MGTDHLYADVQDSRRNDSDNYQDHFYFYYLYKTEYIDNNYIVMRWNNALTKV